MPASDRPARDARTPDGLGARGAAALAALHAVLFAAAFPPAGLWPLALVSLAPLTWLAVRARRGTLVLAVVLGVETVMWLVMKSWMTHVTGPGYALLAVYMAGYTTVFVAIVRRAAVHRATARWPLAVVVPVVWVGLECLRGEVVFTGYPWYLLGHPLVEWPLLVQIADLGGAYLVSAAAAATAGAVVDLARRETAPAPWRRRVIAAGAVAILWVGAAGYGAWRLAGTPAGDGALRVLLVQTNLPQNNKLAWTPEAQEAAFESFSDLTRRALEATRDDDGPDLVVWPETMLPGVGFELDTIAALRRFGASARHLWSLGAALAQQAADAGVPMLVGSRAWVGGTIVDVTLEDGSPGLTLERAADYNSAYLVTGAPPYQRADKVLLTPFGEVIPYASAWPWLEEKIMWVGARGMRFTLDAAPAVTRLRLAAGDREIAIATPICFEDAVGRVCRRMVYANGEKAASLLINLSNDGWFAGGDGGRRHHAQLARFRAIENRVPLLRCANTGLTVAIDSAGRLTGRVGEGRYGTPRIEGWLDVAVTLDPRRTVYGAAGEVPGWLALVGTLVLVVRTLIGPKKEG